MNRYTVTVQHRGGVLWRTVDFDGERVTPVRVEHGDSGPGSELAPPFAAAIEAILAAHHVSGHAGESVTIHVGPA